MKYISDKRLEEILETSMVDDMDSEELLMTIIMYECKELLQEQWQTIGEFKANPVDGWAFVKHLNLDKPVIAYIKDCVFYVSGSFQDSALLTHVMPIKTPEAPK